LRAILSELPRILSLAVPIVLGMAGSTLISVTDTLMLAPLGALPLAAVGMTGAVSLMMVAAIAGLLSALSVRIGAAYGARAGRAIPVMLRAGLMLGLTVGVAGAGVMLAMWPLMPLLGQPAEVIAIAFPYWASIALMLIPYSLLTVFASVFEAVDRPWLGTALALFAVLVNIPLNYALIWGIGPFPQLGLLGAGLASLLAETIALALAFGLWRFAPSLRRLRLRGTLSWADMRATLRLGAPMGVLYIAETGAMAVATLIIGLFGTVALAGNQVAMSVAGLLYMVPLGVAEAVSIRVAQARGARAAQRLRPIVFAALLAALVWLIGAALLLGLGGARIAAAISNDAEVIAVAATIFFVFALTQVMDGVQSTMLGALRGLSDTGFAASVSTAAYWLLGLPLGWVLAHQGGMGPAGVWAGFVIALSLAGAAMLVRFWHKTR
jgi:multidrug resistance protein, MATE family